MLRSTYGILSNGLPFRYSILEQKYFKSSSYEIFNTIGIRGNRCHDQKAITACILGEDISPSWALLGDSFAGQLSSSFMSMLEKENLSGIQLADGGCPFILGFEFNKKRGWSCSEVNNKRLTK